MNNQNWFRWITVFICIALLLARSWAQSKPAADLIVNNAKVWSVDKSVPSAQAVAVVLGERIVAVGSSAEVDQWRGARTLVIDAGGKLLLLPGFNDAHLHFVSGGMQLSNIQLKDATSP
jgi:predicted amidohydrolase YtcJ